MIASDGLRAVVIKGTGAQAFAAGADIGEFAELRSNAATAIAYNAAIAAALESVQLVPVPVVAMISGLAIGGGCELAAACDVRIADTTCRLGIPIGRLGVTLGYTEARLLTELIGPAALKYLLMSGELIDASHAMRMGLLQRVVEPGDLVTAVVQFVETVVANSEVTMRAAKQVVRCAGGISPRTTPRRSCGLLLRPTRAPTSKRVSRRLLRGREPAFTMGEERNEWPRLRASGSST